MRILLTNTNLERFTGSELYIRDVSTALMKRGHLPIAYSPRVGPLGHMLRDATIPVTDDLNTISVPIDVIHGQHHMETMTAIEWFPDVPAVFFCHGWIPWVEAPPVHPRILHYVAVSGTVRDRMIYEYGIPLERITIIPNFVDLTRFKPRTTPLPEKPSRALILSNHGTESSSFVRNIREACAREGISVDLVGFSNGNQTSTPEDLIPEYELVFARGRATMESAAVGAAVICCDAEGASEMVNSENWDWLQQNNFGLRVLSHPGTVEWFHEQILRYDAADATRVAENARATISLDGRMNQIIEVYDRVLTEWQSMEHKPTPDDEARALSRYLEWVARRVPVISDELDSLYEKHEAANQEISHIAEQLMQLNAARVTLEGLVSERGNALAERDAQIHALTGQINLLSEAQQSQGAALVAAESQLQTQAQELQTAWQMHAQRQQEVHAANAQIETLRAELAAAQSALHNAVNTLNHHTQPPEDVSIPQKVYRALVPLSIRLRLKRLRGS